MDSTSSKRFGAHVNPAVALLSLGRRTAVGVVDETRMDPLLNPPDQPEFGFEEKHNNSMHRMQSVQSGSNTEEAGSETQLTNVYRALEVRAEQQQRRGG